MHVLPEPRDLVSIRTVGFSSLNQPPCGKKEDERKKDVVKRPIHTHVAPNQHHRDAAHNEGEGQTPIMETRTAIVVEGDGRDHQVEAPNVLLQPHALQQAERSEGQHHEVTGRTPMPDTRVQHGHEHQAKEYHWRRGRSRSETDVVHISTTVEEHLNPTAHEPPWRHGSPWREQSRSRAQPPWPVSWKGQHWMMRGTEFSQPLSPPSSTIRDSTIQQWTGLQ